MAAPGRQPLAYIPVPLLLRPHLCPIGVTSRNRKNLTPRPIEPVEADHPDLANAVTVRPICQEEPYNPGLDVSINPNENSILTS